MSDEFDQGSADQVRVKYVRITNGLDVDFTDRHDGVPVRLRPGETKNLPLDMAAHFFGWSPEATNEQMLKHVCKRQGWNTPQYVNQNPETRKTRAEELFSKLKIEPIMFKLVQVETDPMAPIPADASIDPTPSRHSVAPQEKTPRRVDVRA